MERKEEAPPNQKKSEGATPPEYRDYRLPSPATHSSQISSSQNNLYFSLGNQRRAPNSSPSGATQYSGFPDYDLQASFLNLNLLPHSASEEWPGFPFYSTAESSDLTNLMKLKSDSVASGLHYQPTCGPSTTSQSGNLENQEQRKSEVMERATVSYPSVLNNGYENPCGFYFKPSSSQTDANYQDWINGFGYSDPSGYQIDLDNHGKEKWNHVCQSESSNSLRAPFLREYQRRTGPSLNSKEIRKLEKIRNLNSQMSRLNGYGYPERPSLKFSKFEVGSSSNRKGEEIAVDYSLITRAVQKVLEHLTTEEQITLAVSVLKRIIVPLAKNMNGGYVIKRCFEVFPDEYNKCLLNAISNNCLEITTDKSGCCVLQECLEHAKGEALLRLANIITSNAYVLSEDPNGNYVVQFLLKFGISHGLACIENSLMTSLDEHFVCLSTNKYGSNVVESFLQYSRQEHSATIIKKLIVSSEFLILAQNDFGNYVVQTALEVSENFLSSSLENIHLMLVNIIDKHCSCLESHPHGQKVLDRRRKLHV